MGRSLKTNFTIITSCIHVNRIISVFEQFRAMRVRASINFHYAHGTLLKLFIQKCYLVTSLLRYLFDFMYFSSHAFEENSRTQTTSYRK